MMGFGIKEVKKKILLLMLTLLFIFALGACDNQLSNYEPGENPYEEQQLDPEDPEEEQQEADESGTGGRTPVSPIRDQGGFGSN